MNLAGTFLDSNGYSSRLTAKKIMLSAFGNLLHFDVMSMGGNIDETMEMFDEKCRKVVF